MCHNYTTFIQSQYAGQCESVFSHTYRLYLINISDVFGFKHPVFFSTSFVTLSYCSKLILSDLCAQLGKPHGNRHCCAQALNEVKILAYYIIDVVTSMLHDSHPFLILSRADSLALQASSQAYLGNLQVRVYSLQPIADFLSLPRKTLIFASTVMA